MTIGALIPVLGTLAGVALLLLLAVALIEVRLAKLQEEMHQRFTHLEARLKEQRWRS